MAIIRGLIPDVSEIAEMFSSHAKDKNYSVNVEAGATENDRKFVNISVESSDVSVSVNQDNIKICRGDEEVGTFDNGESGRKRALDRFDFSLG